MLRTPAPDPRTIKLATSTLIILACLITAISWKRISPSLSDHARWNSGQTTNSLPASRPPSTSVSGKSDEMAQARMAEAYGKLPLRFEANEGQTDDQVKFLSRGNGYGLFLTSTETILRLNGNDGQPDKNTVVRMKLLGANPAPQSEGIGALPGNSNYFVGSNARKWRTNVSNYSKVQYRNVYPGIDLLYYGNNSELEYDFVITPGSTPEDIKLNYDGINKLALDESGDLILHTRGGEMRQYKPLIYQEVDGAKRKVEGQYVLVNSHTVSFRVDEYDVNRPLIIDPVLAYSSYLGGSGIDAGNCIAVDASGDAYVVGTTASTDFPAVNALQPFSKGNNEVFVGKINASGSALLYSTYLGGTGNDSGSGIAIDRSGNAYIVGTTQSSDFPTANALQSTLKGNGDGFVAKLNNTGSMLIYSTYFGGSRDFDGVSKIAVDNSDNAYIVGSTNSTDLPVVNPVQANYGGGFQDAFAAKLGPSGTNLSYSTYLGGNDWEQGADIAIDQADNAYLTGFTQSDDFPTANPIQAALGGGGGNGDAFVVKLGATGSALIYSTYLGGSELEQGYGIVVDKDGNAYVTGRTQSSDFPTSNAFQSSLQGTGDAFVAKLNPTGSALIYSTYLGGVGNGAAPDDEGRSIAVDPTGSAYVTGSTFSTNFPTVNPIQPTLGGTRDAFVTKLNPDGSALIYSTYLGGNNSSFGADEFGTSIAVDGSGSAYITGVTHSESFPVVNPFQQNPGGDQEGFVAKITVTTSPTPTPTPTPCATITLSPSLLPDGTVEAVYDQTITAGGGTASYNFAVTSGALPAGLTLSSSGQLSGTPTTAGDFNFTVTAADINGCSGNQSYAVSAQKATPVVSWGNPADIAYGTALGATQLNATANVAGSFAYTPAAGTVLNAGDNQTLSVTFTPIDTANYQSSSATVRINVLKATLSLTWSDPADITYGTALGDTQLNATSSVPGSFIYTPAAGTVLKAGSNHALSVSFTPTDQTNYNTASATVHINVAKATPVITWGDPSDIVYGTALGSAQLNAIASVPGSFTYTPAAGTVLNAGNAQVLSASFTPTDMDDYNAASATAHINVLKATPTVTWDGTADITYGTPLGGTQLNATASVPGSFSYTPPAGTILNVGSNQPLSVSFTPADASNYNAATVSVKINVLKATPLITWAAPPDITFGTALSGAQLNATASVPGTLTFSPDVGTVLNAGASQTLSVSFVPNDTSNYNNTSASVLINVLKATPLISWNNPADITYGMPLGAAQLNATANVAGSFSYAPAAGTVLNAGSGQSLSANFTPADLSNYNTATAGVLINVLKATASFSNLSSPVITYGTPSTTLSGKISAGALIPTSSVSITLNGVTQSAVINSGNGSFSAAFATGSLGASASPYSISYDYAGDSNFFGAGGSGTLTVSRADTSTGISSSSATSTYGQPVTYTVTVTSGSGTPTGSAQFFDGAASLGVVALSNGGASLTTSALAAGTHSITASYLGGANFNASTSVALTQTVNQAATSTALASSLNPLVAGQSVTFTASVTSGGIPVGSVEFFDGVTSLGVVPLSGGSAARTITTLGAGSHQITAVYSGNANFLGSTSAALTQTVAAPTPAGKDVTVQASVGSTTVQLTFTKVSAAGNTTVTPINPASAGAVPGDFVINGSNLAFNIQTTATFTGKITVVFYLSSVTDPTIFNSFQIIHYVNGQPNVEKTTRDFASKTISATVTSL